MKQILLSTGAVTVVVAAYMLFSLVQVAGWQLGAALTVPVTVTPFAAVALLGAGLSRLICRTGLPYWYSALAGNGIVLLALCGALGALPPESARDGWLLLGWWVFLAGACITVEWMTPNLAPYSDRIRQQ